MGEHEAEWSEIDRDHNSVEPRCSGSAQEGVENHAIGPKDCLEEIIKHIWNQSDNREG